MTKLGETLIDMALNIGYEMQKNRQTILVDSREFVEFIYDAAEAFEATQFEDYLMAVEAASTQIYNQLIDAGMIGSEGRAKVTARASASYLVREYATDAPAESRTYTHTINGVDYTVTVARKLTVDAEPVVYVNLYPDGRFSAAYDSKEEAVKRRFAGHSTVPYHPVPQPATDSTPQLLPVAHSGVVEEIEAFIAEVDVPEPHCNCPVLSQPPCRDCVNNSGLRELRDNARAALAKITELPTPSYSAKKSVINGVMISHLPRQARVEMAAALLEEGGS